MSRRFLFPPSTVQVSYETRAVSIDISGYCISFNRLIELLILTVSYRAT